MRMTLSALTAALTLALVPMPAMADDGMSVMQTVGVFVLIPFGIWGVIWFLWMLPKWRRESSGMTGHLWDPRP